jgi:uncharacterized protein with HEPN domain
MSRKKQRDIELFLVDVFIAIEKIKEYVKPFSNEEDFRHSSLHWDATIRQLEVIGEALNNLLNDEEFSALSPDYFRKIVNFRNIIVHGYFGIDLGEVWNIISEKLDILNVDLLDIVQSNIKISTAINSEIDEYNRLNDTKTVEFLIKMRKKLYA